MTFADRIGRLDAAGDHAPLYKQLQRALREAIQKKVLSPDDALPAERDLAVVAAAAEKVACEALFQRWVSVSFDTTKVKIVVPEVKQLLKFVGLKTSGNKKELLERLQPELEKRKAAVEAAAAVVAVAAAEDMDAL